MVHVSEAGREASLAGRGSRGNVRHPATLATREPSHPGLRLPRSERGEGEGEGGKREEEEM